MLSIPTAQLGNRLFLDPRPLLPILVAWGAAMAVIGLEDDIGFAALLFVLFIGLLWVATGRVGYLMLGLVLFGVGAFIAAHYFGQVHMRVDQWLNPWPDHRRPGTASWPRPSSAWAPGASAAPASASTTSPGRSPSSPATWSSPPSAPRWAWSAVPRW